MKQKLENHQCTNSLFKKVANFHRSKLVKIVKISANFKNFSSVNSAIFRIKYQYNNYTIVLS